MNIKYLTTAIAVSGSLFIAGCGDSGTSTNGSRVSGVVSNYNADNNSMDVANVSFDISGAEVETDGGSITNGMSVLVDGSIDGNSGVAEKITYDSEIEGIVMAHDMVNLTMTVMGQAVSYTTDTVFNDDDESDNSMMQNIDPSVINVGSVVEVSGMLVNGVVEASRIEYKRDQLEPGEDVELKGYISDYNPADDSFSIGGCSITVNDTTQTEIEDNVVLTNGAFVEVESSEEYLDVAAIIAGTCVMPATEIENEDDENEYDDLEDDDDDDLS